MTENKYLSKLNISDLNIGICTIYGVEIIVFAFEVNNGFSYRWSANYVDTFRELKTKKQTLSLHDRFLDKLKQGTFTNIAHALRGLKFNLQGTCKELQWQKTSDNITYLDLLPNNYKFNLLDAQYYVVGNEIEVCRNNENKIYENAYKALYQTIGSFLLRAE